MRVRTGLVALALVCLALPAWAGGGKAGDVEIGFYTGYGAFDTYDDSGLQLKPEDDIFFGARFGFWFARNWNLEVAFQRLPTTTESSADVRYRSTDFDQDSARFNLAYNFRPERVFRPYITLGVGAENTQVGYGANRIDQTDQSYNGGVGARWFISPGFGLRLDLKMNRVDYDVIEAKNNIEASYGFYWAFGGGPAPDDDGDGVANRKDNCPGTPNGAVVDKHGCPIDSDGDGVPDGIDRCPDTPAGWPVDNTGCPLDSDGDGVPDGRDDCPGTPRGAVVDDNGCPVDSDGDGVPDGIDQCPDTPAGARVDSRGCPRDSDGDGVPDGIDQCANTPRGAVVDARGCPLDDDGDGVPNGIDQCLDTPPGTKVDAKGCSVIFDVGRDVLVLEGVKFDFNSAELTSGARTILDRIAQALVQYPDVNIEVAGYTDSVGNDAYNLRLSQARANAVRDYLISKGVAASRLSAKGYGEADPIASNDTEEGRERNRRVVLKKLN